MKPVRCSWSSLCYIHARRWSTTVVPSSAQSCCGSQFTSRYVKRGLCTTKVRHTSCVIQFPIGDYGGSMVPAVATFWALDSRHTGDFSADALSEPLWRTASCTHICRDLSSPVASEARWYCKNILQCCQAAQAVVADLHLTHKNRARK